MPDYQRVIDKAEISRLQEELDTCHASYGKTVGEVTALKLAVKGLYEKIASQSELMRAQVGMHESIIDALQSELKSQEPRIVEARQFLKRMGELGALKRKTDPAP